MFLGEALDRAAIKFDRVNNPVQRHQISNKQQQNQGKRFKS